MPMQHYRGQMGKYDRGIPLTMASYEHEITIMNKLCKRNKTISNQIKETRATCEACSSQAFHKGYPMKYKLHCYTQDAYKHPIENGTHPKRNIYSQKQIPNKVIMGRKPKSTEHDSFRFTQEGICNIRGSKGHGRSFLQTWLSLEESVRPKKTY